MTSYRFALPAILAIILAVPVTTGAMAMADGTINGKTSDGCVAACGFRISGGEMLGLTSFMELAGSFDSVVTSKVTSVSRRGSITTRQTSVFKAGANPISNIWLNQPSAISIAMGAMNNAGKQICEMNQAIDLAELPTGI
ncbi:hypothetical protein LJR098_002317 [Rhizobium sp. LjRoot98]|uniref:hypothetical protein n=1 Tax=unclassified Rhizobium TaxID=2613769 RepID=UPI0007140804|nr:hypothetical protein [Rhizobium sp. Root1204]KQV33505.1 hypothetical protein ASC96_30275 [Rhizobium sp. Root1204]